MSHYSSLRDDALANEDLAYAEKLQSISDDDLRKTYETLHSLCKPGARAPLPLWMQRLVICWQEVRKREEASQHRFLSHLKPTPIQTHEGNRHSLSFSFMRFHQP